MNDMQRAFDTTTALSMHLHESAWDKLALVDGMHDHWTVNGETFDVEDSAQDSDPLVFVRRSDGARFQVDVTVTVGPLPARDQS